MDADFLVLKVRDHAGSLGELSEGESLPLGSRAEVRKALENALPSIDWDGSSGLWWSGETFSIEVVLPPDANGATDATDANVAEDAVRSLTLKARLNPALSAGPWLRSDEAELESFLLALCDPQDWSLFELGSGRLYELGDEPGERGSGSVLRTAGLAS
ncbi:MAG: hypothetical protein ABUT39_10775 [Acidobacteriota bacterium]